MDGVVGAKMKTINKIVLTTLIGLGSFGFFGKSYGQDIGKYDNYIEITSHKISANGHYNLHSKEMNKKGKINNLCIQYLDSCKTDLEFVVDHIKKNKPNKNKLVTYRNPYDKLDTNEVKIIISEIKSLRDCEQRLINNPKLQNQFEADKIIKKCAKIKLLWENSMKE